MNLPLELLDLIIQDLAQEEDLDSVRAFCLTSGQLVHICRKYLFLSVQLIEDADAMKRFGRLLEQNPSLSSHIRELDIHLPQEYSSKDGLSFLHHLNLVERFMIGFICLPGENAHQRRWSSLSKGFVDSLLSFIERNPITEQHLFAIDGFPLSTFRLFMDLRKVVLLDVTASTDVGADSPTTPIPLTSLDLQQGLTPFSKTFAISSMSFDLTGLKKLVVDFRYEDQNLDLLQRLLSMSNCLEDLEIIVDGFTSPPYLGNFTRHISPNPLKTLRNLSITLRIFAGENFPPYGRFEDELSLISGSNVLEKLEFRVMSGSTHLDLNHAAWNRLDEVLSVDGGFPFLKTVKVHVAICHYGSIEEWEEIRRAIDDILDHNFRRLKGNLSFVYAAEVGHM